MKRQEMKEWLETKKEWLANAKKGLARATGDDYEDYLIEIRDLEDDIRHLELMLEQGDN